MGNIKKIMNFGLKNGFYGTLTEDEIIELCKECNTDIYSLELASVSDLEDLICMGEEPYIGLVEVQEGIYYWLDLTFIDDEDFIGYAKVKIS